MNAWSVLNLIGRVTIEILKISLSRLSLWKLTTRYNWEAFLEKKRDSLRTLIIYPLIVSGL